MIRKFYEMMFDVGGGDSLEFYKSLLKEANETIENQSTRIKALEDGLRELVKWHEPDGRWNYTAAVEKAKQLLNP